MKQQERPRKAVFYWMIENFENKMLAMEPKAATTMINSLAKSKNVSLKLFNEGGQIENIDKPRIVQGLHSYYGADNSYSSKPFLFVDGIAIVPVNGALIHRLGYVGSYYSGYDAIVNMFDAANNDADVKGILLLVNSPGGTVAGCFDACDHMYEAKGAKPVWSLYDDMACSGAMCIGSIADRRFTTQTAISGSIGVVQIHASYENMLDEVGMKVTLIYAGENKVDGNPYKNLPQEVYDEFKGQCDALRVQFAEKVSRNIGIPLEDVLATEAKTYTGQEAVDAGLADEVVNSNNIIQIFKQSLSELGSDNNRSVTMSDLQPSVTSESAITEPDAQVTQTDDSQSHEVERESEQQRCESIITSPEASGKSKLANHLAFKTNMSAQDAIATLQASASETDVNASVNPLDSAMAATEQPNIAAMGEDQEVSEAQQIVGAYKQVVGE
ncbi:S49 family peptidase [Glaciecola siphonariae]|uniref:S49 family peptidase n=1 Tax=Glaciecola siphonariae TaxID=521012 RepID=A0ABV9LUR5_9ALTE